METSFHRYHIFLVKKNMKTYNEQLCNMWQLALIPYSIEQYSMLIIVYIAVYYLLVYLFMRITFIFKDIYVRQSRAVNTHYI